MSQKKSDQAIRRRRKRARDLNWRVFGILHRADAKWASAGAMADCANAIKRMVRSRGR